MKVFSALFLASVASLMGVFSSDITVLAQTNRSRCSFNGNSEPCTVNPWANGSGQALNLAVTWLGDGKQSFYAFNNGSVMITEDNGRPTSGAWIRQSGRIIVTSSRGNVTVIPW